MKRTCFLLSLLTGCAGPAAGLVPSQPLSELPASSLTMRSLGESGIDFAAASPDLRGNAREGFVFPKCAAVERLDVRGGATIVSLKSDDPQLRVVPTATENRFALEPVGIPDGNSVARLTATAGSQRATVDVRVDGTICGKFTEYLIPTAKSGPISIAVGSDKALWFTESATDKIGRLTTTGVFSETAVAAKSKPFGLAAGPDGNLWFTEPAANKIGRITTSKAVKLFGIPTAGSSPNFIAAGTDKRSIWFTEGCGNNLGRIDTTAQSLNEYAIPTSGSGAYGISSGPNGLMFFTEYYGNKIGWVPQGGGTVKDKPLSNTPGPLGITSIGSNVWFTDNVYNAIGVLTASTTGYFPTKTQTSAPNVIAAGPDGALWFTEGNVGKIGRITNSPTSPTMTEYKIPTANSGPFGIATGPDGSIWFTESYTGKIGRIQ
ncbi:MAG: hypothetical protein JO199_05705 [Candidatus Eremiobacteraeota bacterium]|nr:hypothetical protein [Candidatus Eremiobacteraeota bacterium]